MDNQVHNIFSGSGCPSHERLREYFEGRLSENDKHLIEKHLVDCEMCSDELEGMLAMKDPEKLDLIVEELNAEIDSVKSKRMWFDFRYRNIAAAAIFIILVGTAFLINMFLDRQQDSFYASETELHKEHSTETEEIIHEDLPSGPQEKSEERTSVGGVLAEDSIRQPILYEIPAANANARVSELAEGVEELIETDIAIEEPEHTIAYITEVDDEAIITEELPEEEYLADAEIVDEDASAEKMVIYENTEVLNGAASTRSSRKAPAKAMYSQPGQPSSYPDQKLVEKALKRFEAKKYKTAAGLFEEILIDHPEDKMANYHLAICNYELNDFDKSYTYFKNVLSDFNSEYYNKAISWLNQIAENGGEFSAQASELLDLVSPDEQ